jgi:hypothetical protein
MSLCDSCYNRVNNKGECEQCLTTYIFESNRYVATNYIEEEKKVEECVAESKGKKKHTKIIDSGERTEFSTGAVRDLGKMKGRFDLMPLEILGPLLSISSKEIPVMIKNYMEKGDTHYLYQAITAFITTSKEWSGIEDMILDVAIHYEMGLEKYPERNWEKGIPLASFMNSALHHYFQYFRGDKDEPHHRAFIWNILNALWTHRHFSYYGTIETAKFIYNLPFSKDWDYSNPRYELTAECPPKINLPKES